MARKAAPKGNARAALKAAAESAKAIEVAAGNAGELQGPGSPTGTVNTAPIVAGELPATEGAAALVGVDAPAHEPAALNSDSASDLSVIDLGERTYPVTYVVRNNGPMDIADPISGKYVAAGGSAVVTFTDAESESAVRENIMQAARNMLFADGAVRFDLA